MRLGAIRSYLAHGAAALALLALAGCDLAPPVEPVLTPKARPAGLVRPAPAPAPVAQARSEKSAELRVYFRRILNDGLTQGLLRTDGGGPDTPYNADTLVRNFERIGFYNEYAAGPNSGRGGKVPMRRWETPVRIEARFGKSVDTADKTRDLNALTGYAARLSRVTGHPIGMSSNANFHVFFAGEDDREDVLAQIRAIEPAMDAGTVSAIRNLPRSTYCLVVAFTAQGAPHVYTRAIALIRSEQPDLMRLSCIHEEVAQGLGLANDSPFARPSIFNDDDEFALLTSHDEKLLAMLYDRRLRPGMPASQAIPVARILAREMMGVNL